MWNPPSDVRTSTEMGRFISWVEDRFDITLATYNDAWQWSVDDVARFWESLAVFLDVRFHSPPAAILEGAMPAAHWFRGATLNYAERALEGPSEQIVLTSYSETRATVRLTRAELRARVAAVRTGLQRLGVAEGDRVAAYLPNVPEAIIGLLASASLGAVWTSCPPEFGVRSVIDRFSQVEPKVLLAVAGYRYAGRDFDRTEELAQIRAALPSVESLVWLPYLDVSGSAPPESVSWDELEAEGGELAFEAVSFDHPLYILYSSGTTGRPKSIVQGHGGMLLEHLKWLKLQDDIGPDDRYFWYSSTGWMAWNLGVASLLCGASLVTLDGAISYPDISAYWRLISEERITYLGVSPAFLAVCRQNGVVPSDVADMSYLRTINCGGSPLPADAFRWVYASVNSRLYLSSASGGTDVGSSFVGGCRLLPVRAGEIACRFLGCDIHAYDESGNDLVGSQGELVILKPMPCMPLFFWGDADGTRFRDAYFSRYPGVWCHGDWITITERGTTIVHGRSDATLNRGGVRLGTSEFYSVVNEVDGVTDSLVVHLEDASGGMGELILFVKLTEGVSLSEELRSELASALRSALSPRHVPDQIHEVPGIPRTSSGKLLEVPVKRILQGSPAESVASKDSMANPEALAYFERFSTS